MKIYRSQLPCPEAEFRAEIASYAAEKEAANKVAGSPAPFPKYEFIRVLIERGEDLEVVEEPTEQQDGAAVPARTGAG
jgi:hypothetical protein